MIAPARVLRAGLVGAMGVLAAGCTAVTPSVTVPVDVTPSLSASPSPSAVWPLTGLPVSADAVDDLAQVTFAVKIENTREARPQKGIEHADIVVEEYVEYGISRLVAVFHSDIPDEVGPIRSLRPMDVNIVGSMFAALVFSGASPGPLGDAQATDQILFAQDLHDAGFFRVDSKPAPHNLWGRTADFVAAAVDAGVGPAVAQFDFADPASGASATVSGERVETIDLDFSPLAHPHWEWDASAGVWDRYEYDEPHVTADGTPITATNVLILRVDVRYVYGYLPESLMIVEGAPGYVATGGAVAPLLWSKSDRRDRFELTTLDGEPIYLAPGQTWIELLPLLGADDASALRLDGVLH